MKTLEGKDLVYEKGRPLRRWYLTEEGWEVAKKIRAVKEGGLPEAAGTEQRGGFVVSGGNAAARMSEGRRQEPSAFSPELDDSDEADEPLAPPLRAAQPSNMLHDLAGLQAPAPEAGRAIGKNRLDGHSVLPRGGSSFRPGGFDRLSPPQGLSDILQGRHQTNDMERGQRLGGALQDKFGTFSGSKVRTTPFKKETIRNHSPTNTFPRKEVIEIDSSPEKPRRQADDPTRLCTSPAPPKWGREEDRSSPVPSFPTFQPIRLQPGSFTVQLVLDNREMRAKNDRDYIQDELVKRGIKPIVRPLEIGDFLWVAKCNDPGFLARHDEEGDEVMLDYVVERKRLDDLCGSIKDGRFHEQKFRLRKSGVHHVVYIIENFSVSPERMTNWNEAIESAIASTQVVDGYFIKRTRLLDETIRYIARMTGILQKMYEVT